MTIKSLSKWMSGGFLLGLLMILAITSVPRVGWAPPLIKMGVVNWEQTIMEYRSFQDELKELQGRREKILKFIQDEYGDLNKRKGQSSDNKKNLDNEMQSVYEDYLKQHEESRRETIEKHHKKIMNAIRQEAIEQGFSLVLSENEILYAANQYTDLTNDVIERLNQSNKDQ